jgi:molecular chaperone DnaK
MFAGVLDVKASAGNNHLGGADFDALIVDWLIAQTKSAGLDVKGDPRALARLKVAAEQAKIELSSVMATPITVPFIGMKDGAPVSLETELTRELFEGLVGELVRSTLKPVEAALKDAKLDKAKVAEVVLVGGSSRIPMVHAMLTQYFGKPPRGGVNPDEAVGLGAAIQAGLKSGAIESGNGIMIADVAPFTLGVEVMGNANDQRVSGLFSPIIPRNCKVPVSRTESYFTTSDNQRSVNVRIFQGEDRFVRNNTFLDAYSVEGLSPKPAGQESIDITFTYDINGILAVKTKINSTGKEAALTVDRRSERMSPLEREEAKKRLEREWATAPGAGAAGAAGAAPAAGTTKPAAPPAPPTDDAQRLLRAAEAKLALDLPSNLKRNVEEKVAALRAALATADKAKVTKAEAELTDALFELE